MFCKNVFFVGSKVLQIARHDSFVFPFYSFKNQKFFSTINRRYLTKSSFYRSNLNVRNPQSFFKMRILLNTVIRRINKNLAEENKVKLPAILEKYGNTKAEFAEELAILLDRHESQERILPTFEYTEQKLWQCHVPFGQMKNKKPVIFSGIGVSKETAEKNCLLTILLYLKELHGYEPHFTLRKRINLPKTETANKKNAVKRKRKKGSRRVSVLQSTNYYTQPFNNMFNRGGIGSALSNINYLQYPQVYGMLLESAMLNMTNFQQTRLMSTANIDSNSNSVKTPVTSPKKSGRSPVRILRSNDPTADNSNISFPTLKKLFPLPKVTLNNIYNILKTPPHIAYTKVKLNKVENWECTYRVLWPEDKTFKALSFNKKEASNMVAWHVLEFLLKNKKIDKAGLPITYTKEEVKGATTLPVVSIPPKTLEHLTKIIDLYKTKFKTQVDATQMEENDGEQLQITLKEPHDLPDIPRQKYLGLNMYLAKEKVQLPISQYKDQFIELINNNRIVIVKGEPGCGKSTRIPQYTLEAWAHEAAGKNQPCRIAVTQPRRIAAISLAERVANERIESVGNIVGYQVRLKSNFQYGTGRILFCTTGILLRYFQSDQKLSKFTHIILDEAHERDVNTDLLMNLLKTALNNNPLLKLIVMSATIDTEMFSRYYEMAPVLEVPGFTYPVKQNFLDSCSKLDLSKTADMCESKVPNVVHNDVAKVLHFIHKNRSEGAILVFLPGWEDIKKIQRLLPQNSSDVYVCCLHSKLQDAEQWKIFSRPPPGVRKIILSTNIAETSVTIDDVVYVVDTGIRKDQRFDIEKGINVIDNHWICKASAAQRSGRAGRVQPGECFRLYPRETYNSFANYSPPEILCTSLTRIVLQAKEISDNVNAQRFMEGLPTPPDKTATAKAVEELVELELLDEKENLTALGRTLAEFQLEPKLAKVLVNAVIFKCVTPIVDIITLFSSEIDMFASSLTDKETIKRVKQNFCNHSDHLSAMRIFEKWLEFIEDADMFKARLFCNEMNLVPHKLETIKQLRSIHLGYLENGLKNTISSLDHNASVDEYSDNDELVKAVLYSGVGTVLQHRDWDIVRNRLKKDVNVLVTRNNHKATITMESINFKRNKFPTKFLLYINETRSNIRRMTLVRECSLISDISVLLFSNKDLIMQDIPPNEFSNKLTTQDQVKVSITGTSIQIICDRKHAERLIECKNAIMACYRYYIYRLTHITVNDGDDDTSSVDHCWDMILKEIDSVLQNHRV